MRWFDEKLKTKENAFRESMGNYRYSYTNYLFSLHYCYEIHRWNRGFFRYMASYHYFGLHVWDIYTSFEKEERWSRITGRWLHYAISILVRTQLGPCPRSEVQRQNSEVGYIFLELTSFAESNTVSEISSWSLSKWSAFHAHKKGCVYFGQTSSGIIIAPWAKRQQSHQHRRQSW